MASPIEQSEGKQESYAHQIFFEGEIKYVRWPHTARPDRDEFTVKNGDEVEIVKREESGFWKVKFVENAGATGTGLIPAKCFYPRVKANCDYLPNQIPISKDEVVGIIEMQVEKNMFKIMKSDGSEGLVPSHCFDKGLEKRYHVPVMTSPTEHCEDANKPQQQPQQQPQPESQAGILDPNGAPKFVYPVVGGFTKKYQDSINGKQDSNNYLYKGGLKYVRWPHTARPNSDELTVMGHEEVEIMEQERSGYWKVKVVDETVATTPKIGVIPAKCFYPRVKAKCDHIAEGTAEISVREGEVVGIIEKQVEGDNTMWKIMKSDGSEGLVPGRFLNAF